MRNNENPFSVKESCIGRTLLIRLALQLLFTTVAIVCNKRVPRISHFLNSYPCDRNNKWAKWENRILWKEQWIFTAIANNPTLSSTTYSGIHIYFPSFGCPLEHYNRLHSQTKQLARHVLDKFSFIFPKNNKVPVFLFFFNFIFLTDVRLLIVKRNFN